MARVDAWFHDFVGRLVQRLPRHDWLPPGSEFWDALKSRFVHHGVREDEADAASLLLMDAPPAHPDQVWPQLLAAVRSLRAPAGGGSAPAAPAPPDPRRFAAWDAAALAHWESLPEAEREGARALVRERLGDWVASRPRWVEGLARGWAHDPSLVAGPPPPPRDGSWKRDQPRRAPAVPPSRAPDVYRLPGDPAPPPPPPAAAEPVFPSIPAGGPAHSDSVGIAAQFLMGLLSVKPATPAKVAECAELCRVGLAAVYEAAERIHVVKTLTDGQEIWGLEERSWT